ncbi:hypothetical protein EOM33_01630 [Candidatus Saccharibacteria bacterium]|nr:hypothetical protein [Candidatus Saccharibacteria bacterium]
MKKMLSLMIAVLTILTLLSSCADQASEAPIERPSPSATDSFIPPAVEPDPSLNANPAPPKEPSKNNGGDTHVDVDLTALSSTMVYGEVFNMMMEPDSYIGKTIKMRGLYYINYYELTAKYYHFVVIQDATACCAQGLEFIWIGEHVYPDDYPEDETEIEVIGVWESYEEEGQTWFRIKTNAISVL